MDEEETEHEYYRRRAAEELAKAASAPDPALAAKHRQLASIYTSRSLQAERRREADEGDKSADGPNFPL